MLITVLTPSYNRANLLPRLFESLLQQTCYDFEWVVVDDGSVDDTTCVVRGFTSNFFPIRYLSKSNGGKHTAINLGVKEAKGDLIFIADSDDLLPNNAIQIIRGSWNRVKNNKELAGIAGLDLNLRTKCVIGSGLASDSIDCNAMEIRYKYHVTGDMKEIFRTSVLSAFPFPEIAKERFCPEQLIWFRIAQKFKLHYINKVIYIAEYQEEGITAGIVKARMNSPIASCMTYAEMLDYDIPFMQKVKAAINYWRFYCCSKKKEGMPRISQKWLALALVGVAMHLRDRRKNKC